MVPCLFGTQEGGVKIHTIWLNFDLPALLLFVFLRPAGSKGRPLITNWGPAAFSDGELNLREKKWQEAKNQSAQFQ